MPTAPKKPSPKKATLSPEEHALVIKARREVSFRPSMGRPARTDELGLTGDRGANSSPPGQDGQGQGVAPKVLPASRGGSVLRGGGGGAGVSKDWNSHDSFAVGE
jgi:hypothetical protein